MPKLVASEAKRGCSRELLSTVIYGALSNAFSWKLLTFSIWLMKQKKILFDHIIAIRDEPNRFVPARPGDDAL